jgi:hypothetical protein
MTQGSKMFNKLIGYLTNTKQDESIAEFAIYNRKVVDAGGVAQTDFQDIANKNNMLIII